MKNEKKVRVRFAPSPTGELHIGGLRTALNNFLFARKNGGEFLLRVEDTDRKRFVEGSMERMIEDLRWAGLEFDGEPYIQSERLEIYKEYVQRLINEGKAYYCFCTPERLEQMREKQQQEKLAPKYDRHCLNLSTEDVKKKIENGEKYVVRFKIPEGTTIFEDLVFGKVEVKNENIDDQVLLKTDGFPTYHLAVVVDDYLMKISHIFRGAEWLPSTPKHVLLYQAFGWEKEMPEFVHMANILNKSKKKLSKREGSVSVADFRAQGYPASALVNFIALLGWNPKTQQEIFTMQELIEQFDVSKMNRAGGVFDIDRLNWISAQHIKRMSVEEIYIQALPFLEKKEYYKKWNAVQSALSAEEKEKYIKKIITIEKDRLEKFDQIGENNQFLFSDKIQISPDDLRWKDSSNEDTRNNLKKSLQVLENISESDWTLDNIEKKLLETAGDKRGDLLFPLRSALTGEKKSPSPFEVSWVLGKDTSIKRILSALDFLV
ncbi:MAG: glutamate--tRNA ligase [Candidatus Moranbacteria bacterium]|jgi:nondiscriminating glutamyl-tRNA synthetase|nr:glutamate--tRNA ligase [Candidatus Moranbacteria bacterium]